MNISTHVMFGILVGTLFFGRPETILLIAIGSMIPDLDREFGFLSAESFRRHQVHRAVCHNFAFLGLVYLVNPFLAIGAFLHTLLDALTTAKDRGVEWLYPFSRFVKRALYDVNGEKLPLDPNLRIYFFQREFLGLVKKTTPDIKPPEPQPWRRTYGPAVSGRLLDEGIFVGSATLTILLVALSALGVHHFVVLNLKSIKPSFTLPLSVAIVGGFIYFVTGEFERRRKESAPSTRFRRVYEAASLVSIGLIVTSVIFAALANPQTALSILAELPYVGAGVGLVILVSFAVLSAATSSKRGRGKDGNEPTIV